MQQQQQQGPNRFDRMSSVQLVRSALMLLASHHPRMSPDDVAHLADDLLDCDKLVKVYFVAEWTASIEHNLAHEYQVRRTHGEQRKQGLCGGETLRGLVERASGGSDEAVSELSCAAIMIGNLIEDQISKTHSDLARTIQLQVNSFWNAGANKVLKEAMADSTDSGDPKKIMPVLPLYMPKAPELADDEGSEDDTERK